MKWLMLNKIIKTFLVLFLASMPLFCFCQVTDVSIDGFPKPYNGNAEKIEVSINDLQKIDSLPNLKPSYINRYKILKFDLIFSRKGQTILATCTRTVNKEYIRIAFGNAKIGSKIYIEKIFAKDLKINKIVSLQSIEVIIK